MASAILSLLVLLAASAGGGGATVATATGAVPAGSDLTLPVVFPEHEVTQDDAYLCTAVKLPDKPLKLVGIESTSDQRIVHHMLLFGEPRRHRAAQKACRLQCACPAFSTMLAPACSTTGFQATADHSSGCTDLCLPPRLRHPSCLLVHPVGLCQPSLLPSTLLALQGAKSPHRRTLCGTVKCSWPAQAAPMSCCTAGARTLPPLLCPREWATAWDQAPASARWCCRWVLAAQGQARGIEPEPSWQACALRKRGANQPPSAPTGAQRWAGQSGACTPA